MNPRLSANERPGIWRSDSSSIWLDRIIKVKDKPDKQRASTGTWLNLFCRCRMDFTVLYTCLNPWDWIRLASVLIWQTERLKYTDSSRFEETMTCQMRCNKIVHLQHPITWTSKLLCMGQCRCRVQWTMESPLFLWTTNLNTYWGYLSSLSIW